jgi:O-antigen/teichoic acid export membrane protein
MLFPPIAVVACLVLIASSGLLGVLVPSLAGAVDTLRILLVSVPLLVLSSITLYVRSGLGRNREVLAIGLVVLAVNVLLNVWLVSVFGLVGAGWALVGSEALQLALVVATADESEHLLLRRAAVVVLWTGLLLAVAVALVADLAIVAVAAAAVLAGTLVAQLRPPRRVPDIAR